MQFAAVLAVLAALVVTFVPSTFVTAAAGKAFPIAAGPAPGRIFSIAVELRPVSWATVALCTAHFRVCELRRADAAPPRKAGAASETTPEQLARSLLTPSSKDVALPEINLPDVEGTSSGFMVTLALLDAATSGELVPAGMVVAGTGTVEADGTVGEVFGVARKVEVAVAAGATVFLTSLIGGDKAVLAAGSRLTVVPVTTVAGAVTWLCDHGGSGALCSPVSQ